MGELLMKDIDALIMCTVANLIPGNNKGGPKAAF